MATITEVIKKADELRLNTIRTEQKVAWVAALDGQIAERLGVTAPTHNWPDEDGELLLPSPYDEVYQLYLCCRIDYYNNETALYGNDKTVYDEALNEALSWWRRGHCPTFSGNVQVM